METEIPKSLSTACASPDVLLPPGKVCGKGKKGNKNAFRYTGLRTKNGKEFNNI